MIVTVIANENTFGKKAIAEAILHGTKSHGTAVGQNHRSQKMTDDWGDVLAPQ